VRAIFLTVALVALLVGPVEAQNGRPLGLTAEAVLLIDPDGEVIFSKNADGDHAPASLVKLMTLYLAFEDLGAGRTGWDAPVTVSRAAAQTPRSRMGLRPGEVVPLRTLLEGVAIVSANDAATAVAEHLAGGEAEFVARMNATAQALGLASTRFSNPHGLPDPAQRSTAQDMARLTTDLLDRFPPARAILSAQSFVFRGRVHARQIPLFENPGGVQALKTGFTSEAGYNLAVAAWRAGRRFLVVLLGAHSRSLSFQEARALFSYGFLENGIVIEEPRRTAPPARRQQHRRSRASGRPAN
jgi:D-alanyl-D-alanine carboxypeptidase